MTNFAHYRTHVGTDPEKFFKSSVFEGTGLRLGTNCLEPGQSQPEHLHEDQDKFYYVVEGHAEFVIGEEARSAGPGMVVWAPAGIKHGVANNGSSRLVMLVGMAPSSRGPSLASHPSRTRKPLTPTTRRRAKRAKRRAQKTIKRARKAAGRARKKAAKTAKRAKSAMGRAKKRAAATAKRAKKAAKRARRALKRGTAEAKRTAKRAKKAAGRTRKKAAQAAKRTKKSLSAAQQRAASTAKKARKAVRRFRKR